MTNPKVDFYFEKAKRFQHEIELLRTIILDCRLNEELKWGCPCYTFNAGNVVLIHTFKEYCALLFFKGALLNDAHTLMIRQTENVQAARQMRFTDIGQIKELQPVITQYIYEAIEIEKAGLKVPLKKTADFMIADELQIKMDELPALRTAFEALTPGRQRGYHLYFAAAKQAKTRQARVEKYIPQILAGKGLED